MGVSDRTLSRRYLQRDFDRVCLFFLFFLVIAVCLMLVAQDGRDAA